MEKNIKFNYKYGLTVLILALLVAIIAIVGLCLNVKNIIEVKDSSIDKTMTIFRYVVLALNVLMLIFIVSILVYAKYVVSKKGVYVKFGVVYKKYALEDITSIAHFTKQDKLVLYGKNEKYAVIVISQNKFGEFVDAVKKFKPDVLFTKDGE